MFTFLMRIRFLFVSVVLILIAGFGLYSVKRHNEVRLFSNRVDSAESNVISSRQFSMPASKVINHAPPETPVKGASIVSVDEIRYSKKPVPITSPKQTSLAERTPDERLPFLVNELIRSYGPSIAALNLSQEDERKLRDFLIERSEAGYIAHDVVTEQKVRTPGDLQISFALAHKAVDEEIRGAFASETAAKILYIIDAYPYLASVNADYSRYFTRAGDPLRDEQVASLAHILMDTYGQAGDYADQRLSTHSAEIDLATGLLPSEKAAIETAKSVLSPGQLRAFTDVLSARNRKFLSQKPQS